MSSSEQALTVDEVLELPAMVPLALAARALNIRRTAAYSMRSEGTFPVAVYQHGRKFQVRRADLVAYLGLADTKGRTQGGKRG